MPTSSSVSSPLPSPTPSRPTRARHSLIAGDSYAIFDIEEVFILLGITPTLCFQVNIAHVRKRYVLSPLA